jgi:hypothetical protein
VDRASLDHISRRIKETKDSPSILVFDLDSTLFDTAERHLAILREFVLQHGQDYPGIEDAVARLTPSMMGWSPIRPLQQLGCSVPETLLPFWSQRFFTDSFCALDTPTSGAVEFVNACYQQGAFIYYLTGRHVDGMARGTVDALLSRGFPFLSGRSTLHLKPEFTAPDKAFKRQAIESIRSLRGRVIATFENEPGNANLFLSAFPDAMHFFLETVHSPEAEAPDPALIRIPDFCLR